MCGGGLERSSLLAPLVLAADLLLLLRGEVVLDVEVLPDLLGGLATDHLGDCDRAGRGKRAERLSPTEQNTFPVRDASDTVAYLYRHALNTRAAFDGRRKPSTRRL